MEEWPSSERGLLVYSLGAFAGQPMLLIGSRVRREPRREARREGGSLRRAAASLPRRARNDLGTGGEGRARRIRGNHSPVASELGCGHGDVLAFVAGQEPEVLAIEAMRRGGWRGGRRGGRVRGAFGGVEATHRPGHLGHGRRRWRRRRGWRRIFPPVSKFL